MLLSIVDFGVTIGCGGSRSLLSRGILGQIKEYEEAVRRARGMN